MEIGGRLAIRVSEKGIMADETEIPVTSITELYWAVHSSQKQRLAMATEYAADPRILAEKFHESRKQFEAEFTGWSAFPFHTRKDPLAFKIGETPVKRTRDLAAALGQEMKSGDHPPVTWKVQNAPELSFIYLDREIQPARTNVETAFKEVQGAPEKAPKKLSLDLLLANANNRTPIVCEVKLTTDRDDDGKLRLSADKDPFFALIQVLASTAHLATEPQIKRLSDNYDVDVDDGRLDVYVMIRGQPAEKAKYWFKILAKTRELAEKLLGEPEINQAIGQIEFLDVEAKRDQGNRTDTDLNPWFHHPPAKSNEFTLNFSRI